MESQRRLRLAGIIVAVSFPLTGIVCFAIASVLIGESRLEGPDAIPALGALLFFLPVIIGLALVGWSYSGWPVPDRGVLARVGLGLAVVCLVGGAASLVAGESGDPNIGGSLLVLVGVVGGAASLLTILRPTPTEPPV